MKKEGRHECSKTYRLKVTADDRRNGNWKIMTDIASVLVFPIKVTNNDLI